MTMRVVKIVTVVLVALVAIWAILLLITGSASAHKRHVPLSMRMHADDLIEQAVPADAQGTKPVAIIAGSGQICHGDIWHKRGWTVAGNWVAWMQVEQFGWCAYRNGSRITRDFGWHGSSWTWGPYCLGNVSFTGARWETYPTWKHAQMTGSLGIISPLGCLNGKTGHASLRISSWQKFSGRLYWDTRYY